MPEPAAARSPFARPPGEAGSAYIAALLVLVVLTLVGLSLALITQSEMQIGANERVQQRLFYAANSGIAASTARALTNADYSSATYSLADAGGKIAGLGFEVEVSPFLPILNTACNLCEVNQMGSYGEPAFRAINHAVTSTAFRRRAGGVAYGQKTLSSMVQVQPWPESTEASAALTDQEELDKLRF